jgi:serine protease Do
MNGWIQGPPATGRRLGGRARAPGVGRSPGPGGAAVVAVSVVSALLASAITVATLVPPSARAPAPATTAQPATTVTAAATPTSGAPAVVRGTPRDQQQVVEAAARKTGPSVLSVNVTGPGPVFGAEPGPVTVAISGTVVRQDGLIVTVWHLVAAAQSMTVSLPDGRNPTAQVLATDTAHDLVVLRIDASGLPVAQFANDARLDIGQTLLALGGPDGASAASVSSGILSATGRTAPVRDPNTGRADPIEGLIQTDAAINFRNEGGPLVDASGAVVGINITAADASQGIGFALPIAAARDVIRQAQSAP